ncbi:MAG: discoidin domain-containing protein [Nitrospira sp.]|nr:discoidin domain-containing protein [Nitrospira sp.]
MITPRTNGTLNVFFILVALLFNETTLAANAIRSQYLRIELPGDERVLSLAEVQVYEEATNIAQQGKATQSSTAGGALAERAIDGNTNGDYFAHSVSSTSSEGNSWWELDLGKERRVSSVVLYNRADCCRDRIAPARIQLLTTGRDVVWEHVIREPSARYQFETFSAAATLHRVSPNLLRNSSFQQQTNSLLPDYWDLHHSAALTFDNLHDQYGIADKSPSPVAGAKVLKVTNSESHFPHLSVMPKKIRSPLSNSAYTFSVYLKAEQDGMEYRVMRAWADGESVTYKLTTEWRRYSTTFNGVRGNASPIQPIMFFPTQGTYYVSAPQLERGDTATEFHPSLEDEVHADTRSSSREQLKNLLTTTSSAFTSYQQANVSAYFEYNYYTSQPIARLILTREPGETPELLIRCTDGINRNVSIPLHGDIAVHQNSQTTVDVPISDLPPGEYTCLVSSKDENTKHMTTSARLVKQPPSATEVRINQLRRTMSINEKPFHIIGMGVGSWKSPPDWYFRDLAAHGINTVFYTRPSDKNGDYDFHDVEGFVSGAARHGLKAIIGIPLAGAKAANWRQRLAGFSKLVSRFKNSSTVIGWFPVDEPAAHTWRDDELMEIHDAIKRLDPYRLIFINWAYDGVPTMIGQEPRGTLHSTDVYSSDYYPFTGQGHNLEGFTSTTIRALSTARIRKRLSHSWIQLYGSMDAWREPTGDELNYMAYLNLIYGGYISYWDTKSNSKDTWARLTTINREVKLLSEELFFNPGARELFYPSTKINFFFSAWKQGERIFLIVAHNGTETETFTYEAAPLVANRTLRTKNYFGTGEIPVVNGHIQDVFRPFECKVYVLDGAPAL